MKTYKIQIVKVDISLVFFIGIDFRCEQNDKVHHVLAYSSFVECTVPVGKWVNLIRWENNGHVYHKFKELEAENP